MAQIASYPDWAKFAMIVSIKTLLEQCSVTMGKHISIPFEASPAIEKKG